MLCVRAPAYELRLHNLAKTTGKTKSHYVRLALKALFDKLDQMEPRVPLAPFQPPPIARAGLAFPTTYPVPKPNA